MYVCDTPKPILNDTGNFQLYISFNLLPVSMQKESSSFIFIIFDIQMNKNWFKKER